MTNLDDKITALTAAWYAYVNLDHHKDRDCHFYIEKVWSYGKPPVYRVSHPGYITDFASPTFKTAGEAHLWLYRALRRRCEDAVKSLREPEVYEDYVWQGEDHGSRVIRELEMALAL